MDIIRLKNTEKYDKSAKLKIDSILNDSVSLIKEGQFNKAILLCDHGLKLYPTDVAILSQKGVANTRLSKFDDAIQCFDLALKYEPKFANALYNKATVKALQNDISEALSLLEQSIKIDSRFIKIAKIDEDFLYLRNNSNFIAIVGR